MGGMWGGEPRLSPLDATRRELTTVMYTGIHIKCVCVTWEEGLRVATDSRRRVWGGGTGISWGESLSGKLEGKREEEEGEKGGGRGEGG